MLTADVTGRQLNKIFHFINPGNGLGKGGEGRGGEGKKAEDKIWLRLRECAQTHGQTDRHTDVKTVYPPVSLRSLGGYNNIRKLYTAHQLNQ